MSRRKNTSRQTRNTDFSKLVPETVVKAKTLGQAAYIKAILSNEVVFCSGCAGTGKAQPYYSKIQTPFGPKTMGDIEVGDLVSTPDGQAVEVLGKFPQGIKDVYRITFDNGSYVDSCKEHLWEVYKDSKQSHPYIVELQDLIGKIKNKNNKRLYSIKLTHPVEMIQNEHYINPYILGVLIGDGCITNVCGFTSADSEIINQVQNNLKDEYKLSHTNDLYYNIIQVNKNGPNKYVSELNHLGLLGKHSYEKFIPKEYLYDSIENRIELLKGLFDTDGTISNNGTIEYSTSSEKLMLDVKYLVESLGGKVRYTSRYPKFTYKNELKTGKLSYRLYCRFVNDFTMFNLKRKVKRIVKRTKYFPILYIDNIQKIGVEECFCIYINHPRHLYLTDNFTPTHNTFLAIGMAAYSLCKGEVDKIVLTRPIVSSGSRKLGALPGDVKEKIAPYLVPVVESLRRLLGEQLYYKFTSEGRIVAEPLELMRGRTFDHSFMILDEAQNCEYEDIIMFVTRMGEGSKVCINGDTDQCDLNYKDDYSPLEDVMDRVKNLDRFGLVHLSEDDIVRNPLIKSFLKATGHTRKTSR